MLFLKSFRFLLAAFVVETVLGLALVRYHGVGFFTPAQLETLVFAPAFLLCFARTLLSGGPRVTATVALASLGACVVTFAIAGVAWYFGIGLFSKFSGGYILHLFYEHLPYSIASPFAGCASARVLLFLQPRFFPNFAGSFARFWQQF